MCAVSAYQERTRALRAAPAKRCANIECSRSACRIHAFFSRTTTCDKGTGHLSLWMTLVTRGQVTCHNLSHLSGFAVWMTPRPMPVRRSICRTDNPAPRNHMVVARLALQSPHAHGRLPTSRCHHRRESSTAATTRSRTTLYGKSEDCGIRQSRMFEKAGGRESDKWVTRV